MTATAVKERPILFSGPMVRAILEGRKTQTRRVMKPQPQNETCFAWFPPTGIVNAAPGGLWTDTPRAFVQPCPYGDPGERLWVRESFDWIAGKMVHAVGGLSETKRIENIRYRADGGNPASCRWTPSIHMPRWASRITLEIDDVRVQRLQEISEEDALAEGIDDAWLVKHQVSPPRVPSFQALWDDINGAKHPWASNPWLWAITFRRIEA
jgi:hypothetical protein